MNQQSNDTERKNLRPLVDEALRLVDEMHALYPHKHGSLRMARAHVHGSAKKGTNIQFITECIAFIGVLRGVHRADKITYPAQHYEDELRQLLTVYRTAYVLIKMPAVKLFSE
jgi:hypothetical protein